MSVSLPISVWVQLSAIAGGAVLGAWTRWGLGLWLNHLYPRLPFGTLLANVIGGVLIGAALAVLSSDKGAEPLFDSALWRLFFITGFLGALTTFSTFSAEALVLLQQKDLAGFAIHSLAHWALSIMAAFLAYLLAARVLI